MTLKFYFCQLGDNDTKICGAEMIKCYNDADDEFSKKEFRETLSGAGQTCNCLPECASIKYDAEISNAIFEWNQIFSTHNDVLRLPPGYDVFLMMGVSYYFWSLLQKCSLFIFCFVFIFRNRASLLQIFFKDVRFLRTHRTNFYNIYDFIADFGGLLGLSMGISILSIYEIFYYCSLRLWVTVKQSGHCLVKFCASFCIFISFVLFLLFIFILLFVSGCLDFIKNLKVNNL